MEYYRKRADEMLKNAYPLMNIYRSERESEPNTFLIADTGTPGGRRSILSTLPLYTISEALLDRIPTRHGIDGRQRQRIKKHAGAQRKRAVAILEAETIEEEISVFTPEDFRENPPVPEPSGVFFEADIPYSEEEYAAHMSETRAFAGRNPNYAPKPVTTHAFRNLRILIHEGRWVMVSKGKAPAIHFVIRHSRLRSAIESFIPPVTESREAGGDIMPLAKAL